MANIAISELETSVTTLKNDDYILVSSKNDNGSFTSAKMLGSVIKTFDCVNSSEVVVYISPTGNDNNASEQYRNHGTDNQKNYPLFSLTAASNYLSRFKIINNISRHYTIKCLAGTYNYTQSQFISNDSCMEESSYVKIEPDNLSTSEHYPVIFNFTQSASISLKITCNCQIRRCAFNGNNISTICIKTTSSFRYNMYGCKISNYYIGVFVDNDVSYIESYYSDGTSRTLSNIENTDIPTIIQDCSIGINYISNGKCYVSGWVKAKCGYHFVFHDGAGIFEIGTGMTRLDCKVLGSYSVEKSFIIDNTVLACNIIFCYDPQQLEINFFNSNTEQTYSDYKEYFTPNISTTISYRGSTQCDSTFQNSFHYVDKF